MVKTVVEICSRLLEDCDINDRGELKGIEGPAQVA